MKLVIAVVAFLFVGCGAGAAELAHRSLVTGADASVAVDEAFAAAYQEAAGEARISSATQTERDQKMAQWDQAADRLEQLLERLNADLVMAEELLGAGNSGFGQVFSRVLGAARELLALLDERGVPAPAGLAQLLQESDVLAR